MPLLLLAFTCLFSSLSLAQPSPSPSPAPNTPCSGADCSGHGSCESHSGICSCSKAFYGYDCGVFAGLYSSCFDDTVNEAVGQTDVGCGGSLCGRCLSGMKCKESADCIGKIGLEAFCTYSGLRCMAESVREAEWVSRLRFWVKGVTLAGYVKGGVSSQVGKTILLTAAMGRGLKGSGTEPGKDLSDWIGRGNISAVVVKEVMWSDVGSGVKSQARERALQNGFRAGDVDLPSGSKATDTQWGVYFDAVLLAPNQHLAEVFTARCNERMAGDATFSERAARALLAGWGIQAMVASPNPTTQYKPFKDERDVDNPPPTVIQPLDSAFAAGITLLVGTAASLTGLLLSTLISRDTFFPYCGPRANARAHAAFKRTSSSADTTDVINPISIQYE